MEQQLNEQLSIFNFHSKLNMQITNSSSPSKERLQELKYCSKLGQEIIKRAARIWTFIKCKGMLRNKNPRKWTEQAALLQP